MAYGGGSKGGASKSGGGSSGGSKGGGESRSSSRSSRGRGGGGIGSSRSSSSSSSSTGGESRSSSSSSRGSSPDHGGYGGPGDSSAGGASAGAGHGGIGGLGGSSRGGHGGIGGLSASRFSGSGLSGAVQSGVSGISGIGNFDAIGDWGLAFGTDSDFKDPSDAIGEALANYHANPHGLTPASLAKAYDLGLVDVAGRLAPEARDYHLTDATMFGKEHPTKPGIRQANIKDIPVTPAQKLGIYALPIPNFAKFGLHQATKAYNYDQLQGHFPGLPALDRNPTPIDPGDQGAPDPVRARNLRPPQSLPAWQSPAQQSPAQQSLPAWQASQWSSDAYKKIHESLYGETDGTQNKSILSLYRKMFAEEDE